jgi:hypothetical protein
VKYTTAATGIVSDWCGRVRDARDEFEGNRLTEVHGRGEKLTFNRAKSELLDDHDQERREAIEADVETLHD